MTLTLSTRQKDLKGGNRSNNRDSFSSFFSSLIIHQIKNPINDVMVIFGNDASVFDVNPLTLTNDAMLISQKSFSEEWDLEDDKYWDNYI